MRAIVNGRNSPQKHGKRWFITLPHALVRLEAACQRGDLIKARSVDSIRSILKTGLDRAFL